MGLDITISERKEYRCPNCGIPVGHTDIVSIGSWGHAWYDFLKKLGYYASYEEYDWYGEDMVLNNEQAKQLADYAVKKKVYNWDNVERVVAAALMHKNKVVINANW